MLKQDKNFRLPKSTKRMMAFMEPSYATMYKKFIIQGMISGSIEPPKEKKKSKRKVKVEDEE